MNKLFTLLLALVLLCAPAQAGWFDKDEQQKIAALEQQLQDSRHTTERWQTISGILGITCVVLLVVGAAIGAKARREVGDEQ